MGIEIEKKYRLQSRAQQESLQKRLLEVGATSIGEELEENTLYAGAEFDMQARVLRLRRTNKQATFTYKERFASQSAIKYRREEETAVENPDALAAILDALGFSPALVYEKKRATWQLADTEVVIDELPFGLFVEIEGEENAIAEVEMLLNLSNTQAVQESYPELTRQYGRETGKMIEARFEK